MQAAAQLSMSGSRLDGCRGSGAGQSSNAVDSLQQARAELDAMEGEGYGPEDFGKVDELKRQIITGGDRAADTAARVEAVAVEAGNARI